MTNLSLTTFLLAFGGGFLTALTPCVYPLIPITWGIMRAGQATNWRRGLTLSLAFGLGLSLVYSLLGFLAATSGQLFGSWIQSPWISWFLSGLFLLMALSLLGLFEIRLPSRFLSWLSRRGGPGIAGSFLMGSASGLIAAPCTGPILIGILGYVATHANPTGGLLLLLTFSLGLSSPFIVLGTASSTTLKLPQGGAWTEWAKHLCGLGLLALFFVYLHPLISSKLFGASLAIALIGIALALTRIFPGFQRSRYLVGQIALALGAVGTLLVTVAPLPTSKSEKPAEIQWITTEKDALAEAQKTGKPVMIDVWADWCVACHELEKYTYGDERVSKLLKEEFVPVKIDATDVTPDVAALTEKYSIFGLPTVLFLTPSGKLCKDLTLTGFAPAEEFLPILEKAKHCLT